MKRLVIIAAIIAISVLAVLLILPAFQRGRAYSGPGIGGNLRSLQLDKEVWQSDGHTNEWPTGEDLFPGLRGRSINDIMRPRYGELYFINRTGASPLAYIPKANGPYRGGEVLILTSNGVIVLHQ